MGIVRKKLNMDLDWRFHRGDIFSDDGMGHTAVYNASKAGGAKGPATKKPYDDSGWERVDLPHDYIRESAYTEQGIGSQGYRELANAWYRKTFTLDPSLRGSHAMLVFEGISTSSVIYLNGSVIERSFSVYSEIAIDVTDRLYFDRINTLAVYTRGDDIEGWWYEGAGIYRHVRLYIKSPVHIAHNGIWANPTLLSEEDELWEVKLELTVENSSYESVPVRAMVRISDGEYNVRSAISESVTAAPDGKTVINMSLTVKKPRRWDVDSPSLYTLTAELISDGEIIDEDCTRIGFRTFRIDANEGFFLNGRRLKIKGTCNHQDHAGVGVALPDSVHYYRVKLLKELGTNAYRCSHNPPAKEILDACDEYGLIVMDENRSFETRADSVKNLEVMVRRDRNHPSVMFYSLFNEEPIQNSAEGAAVFRRLKSAVKRLDDTRIVVGAINGTLDKGGAGEYMDAFGLNYSLNEVTHIHSEYPDMPIIGSENNSAVTTRGCYNSDREVAHVLSGYDEEVVPWGSNIRNNWDVVRKNDHFAGIFIWTGFDYRGEPTPFKWPSASSQFGIMDTCGFPKDSYYFNKATFTDEPMMYILPHWNYSEGETVRVMTVTNCEEAELFLNGRSLGRKNSDICEQVEWSVPFEKGTISAIGYKNGEKAAYYERKTAGDALRIKLSPDREWIGNEGGDTVPVRVAAVDKDGIEHPLASHLVHFEIEGEGYIRGVGNGDPNSHEPEHTPYRHLYCGLCQVLVSARLGAKSIKLRAHAEGLESAETELSVVDGKIPEYVFSSPNNAITGVLATISDSEEKPDPKKVYGDDDMNSFTSVVVENTGFEQFLPVGFKSGWREIRIPVTLARVSAEGKIPAIKFSTVICERAEFYIEGRLIYEVEPEYRAPVTVPLGGVKENTFEVRCLMKAREDVMGSCGFAVSVSLTEIDA